MDFFDDPNWRLTKFLLSCMGAWPFQPLGIQRAVQTTVILIIASIFIPEIARLITIWGDLNMVIECALLMALHVVAIIKLLNLIINLQKMKQLLERIRKDWQSNISKVEAEALQEQRERSQKFTHGYVYYIYATTCTYMAMPTFVLTLNYCLPLNESRPIPELYQTEFFIDPVRYKIPIMIHAHAITLIPSTVSVAFDAFYANCIEHASMMFMIIGYRLQTINYGEGGNDPCVDEIDQSLIDCIVKHRDVIAFAGLLQSTFTDSLFCLIGVNMLSLSITSFYTTTKLDDLSEVVRFGGYAMSQIIHLFFLSRPAQKLMDYSEQIYLSLYQGTWYNSSLKTKRLLVLLTMRGSNPSTISAGKLYLMSLQNFCTIVKTSASYFAVLTSLQ